MNFLPNEITQLKALVSYRTGDLLYKRQKIEMQMQHAEGDTKSFYKTELQEIENEMAINKAIGDKLFIASLPKPVHNPIHTQCPC